MCLTSIRFVTCIPFSLVVFILSLSFFVLRKQKRNKLPTTTTTTTTNFQSVASIAEYCVSFRKRAHLKITFAGKLIKIPST